MFDLWFPGVMVGRFNVRLGDGAEWLVWDNATNGYRGRCASEGEANELAGDLELQYDVLGPRDPKDVRRLDTPVRVGVWQRDAGELTSWVRENGRWIGRVKLENGQISWIDQADLRPESGSLH